MECIGFLQIRKIRRDFSRLPKIKHILPTLVFDGILKKQKNKSLKMSLSFNCERTLTLQMELRIPIN